MKKRTKANTRAYQDRCHKINTALMVYRAALEALVGWGEFQNIDSRATSDLLPMQHAAKEWAEGFWSE